MMTADHLAIQLQSVGLKLGHRDFDFDLGIERGVVTAVAGASGSGKSTLLNLIAGFEQPQVGRVLIDGQDVTDLPPARRPISLVFQDNNLFAHLDLFTNIGLGIHPAMRLTPGDRLTVSRALERVGLAGFERRLPGSLSGGERQRAAFARALVRRKPVLLLDEPFAALDPGLRSSMADLLIDLHRDSVPTIVLVTHDPRDIERLADRVIFLDQGRVIVDAPTAEFWNKTGLNPVASFLGVNRMAVGSP